MFLVLLVWPKILFGPLSDEDRTYYQNKVRELEAAQLSLLKVATQCTVNSALADIAAHALQVSKNTNIVQKNC